ncbi:hypothetical protein Mp_3g13680 [Marchantia polymorpha subsp. ruderalis]|uniref:Uncharacterized protein n=2 Tax=Marchantia polymorpha TaxID=3197 RepID=A0AAF6B0H1_MARPO|nr:hypothetical protein MARPO_0004s0303 [Marchantia polymorpha]BBN05505.1 hypothetical protein Mp_3g13680 [Marchantia polymorpha subsp. ruderalis]|eukprot:PTQ49080.1 hypothetical protein MARPO_0004s0303 [Marchantia polymorpha]
MERERKRPWARSRAASSSPANGTRRPPSRLSREWSNSLSSGSFLSLSFRPAVGDEECSRCQTSVETENRLLVEFVLVPNAEEVAEVRARDGGGDGGGGRDG